MGLAHDRNEKYGHIIFSKGLLSDSTRYTGGEILADVEKIRKFLHLLVTSAEELDQRQAMTVLNWYLSKHNATNKHT